MLVTKEMYDELTFNDLLGLVDNFNKNNKEGKFIKIEDGRVSLFKNGQHQMTFPKFNEMTFKKPLTSIRKWFLTTEEQIEEIKEEQANPEYCGPRIAPDGRITF